MISFFGWKVYVDKMIACRGRFTDAIELEVRKRVTGEVREMFVGILLANDRERSTGVDDGAMGYGGWVVAVKLDGSISWCLVQMGSVKLELWERMGR